MVADAVCHAVNAVEKFDQLEGLDDQAGLFTHFADYAGSERLAHLKQAAGQRPLATKRFGSAAHEKNAAGVDHHGSDADQRCFWIFSLHGSP
jgi:alanine racemase